MKPSAWFTPPPAPPAAALAGSRLAHGRVVDVSDPEQLARVQVEVYGHGGAAPLRVWARVASPLAGADYGAWWIPNVDDEVLLGFIEGDVRFPVVLGSLWNGGAAPPRQVQGSEVSEWELRGRRGSRFHIDETDQPTITLETAGGVKLELIDESGGTVRVTCGANTVTIDSGGVKVQAAAEIRLESSTLKISAGLVQVDTPMATFSGVVKCEVLQSTAVVSTSYTPGAGNIW
jgi:uncharacterized protein involved in type VI secretion and phage assembly